MHGDEEEPERDAEKDPVKEKDNQELMVLCRLMKKNSFKEEGFMISVNCCGLVR